MSYCAIKSLLLSNNTLLFTKFSDDFLNRFLEILFRILKLGLIENINLIKSYPKKVIYSQLNISWH